MIDAEGNILGNFLLPVSYAMYATVAGLKKSGATGLRTRASWKARLL